MQYFAIIESTKRNEPQGKLGEKPGLKGMQWKAEKSEPLTPSPHA